MSKVWIAGIFSLVCFANIAGATGGGMDGSGGDIVAQDFVSLAREAHKILSQTEAKTVDPASLMDAINTTQVNSQDKLFLEGSEVDALNFPGTKKILVSRSRWIHSTNDFEKMKIALHEYFGIMGLDDTNYKLSSQLDSFGVCQRSHGIRVALELVYKRECFKITSQDLKSFGGFDLSSTMRNPGIDLLRTLKPGDFLGFGKNADMTLVANNLETIFPGALASGTDNHAYSFRFFRTKVPLVDKSTFHKFSGAGFLLHTKAKQFHVGEDLLRSASHITNLNLGTDEEGVNEMKIHPNAFVSAQNLKILHLGPIADEQSLINGNFHNLELFGMAYRRPLSKAAAKKLANIKSLVLSFYHQETLTEDFFEEFKNLKMLVLDRHFKFSPGAFKSVEFSDACVKLGSVLDPTLYPRLKSEYPKMKFCDYPDKP